MDPVSALWVSLPCWQGRPLPGHRWRTSRCPSATSADLSAPSRGWHGGFCASFRPKPSVAAAPATRHFCWSWRDSRARSAVLTPLILTKSAWRHGSASGCPLLIRLQDTLIFVKGRSSTWPLVTCRDRGPFLFRPVLSLARQGCHAQLAQVRGGTVSVKGSRHRCLLVIVNLKYRQEPGDCQNLLDLGAQIQEC